MICIYFTKSKLNFTKLDDLEIVKQFSGYPTWETDYNSHGTRTQTGSGSRWFPECWTENEQISGRTWYSDEHLLTHRLCMGHPIEIPKAECVDRELSAYDLEYFWSLPMEMNSSEFYPSFSCASPCRLLSECKQECHCCPMFRNLLIRKGMEGFFLNF